MRRALDDRVDVALVLGTVDHAWPVDGNVARRFRMKLRRVRLERVARRDDGRLFLVFHGNEIGAVLRLTDCLRDDHRDGLADIEDTFAGERWPERLDQILPAAPLDRRVTACGLETGFIHIGGGEHRQHVFRSARRSGIDRDNAGKGVRRAHEYRKRLVGKAGVVHEAAVPAHQRVVLEPDLARSVLICG